MRVIAGSARHLPLKSVAGNATRPTSDKIKETLFNILNPRLYDARFLDLFAGTGGIGIEALSRGASFAVFVDNARAAAGCIQENLEFTKFEEQSLVYKQDVISALRSLEKLEPFDIVFMDPPYGKDLELQVLSYLKRSSVISDNTLVIVEANKHTDPAVFESYGYQISRIKEYKTNQHVFLYRTSEEE